MRYCEDIARIGEQEPNIPNIGNKSGIKVKPDYARIRQLFYGEFVGLSFVLKQMEKREGTFKLYDNCQLLS
jgi:hypothetical protein